jgi:phosphatidylserine decarboxylase
MAGELRDNRGRGTARWSWPPIHPEGRKLGLAAAAIALVVLVFLDWEIVGWPLLMLSGGIFAFFRDPERVVPQGDATIVSPADGLVTLIQQVPPPELQGDEPGPEPAASRGLGTAPVTRISIFMSMFDVHINRAPAGGTVRRIAYIPGAFVNADLDKASEDNERQHFLVERPDGVLIGFTQIAGLIARRIVSFVKPGDVVATGQRVGLIRFGSRVDVYLPQGTDPLVVLGQTTVAGETVLAEIGRAGLIEGMRQ